MCVRQNILTWSRNEKVPVLDTSAIHSVDQGKSSIHQLSIIIKLNKGHVKKLLTKLGQTGKEIALIAVEPAVKCSFV